ncbi:hypothetical protein [Burkholderia diffusa]|uniref:Uncharacterized protein n=1 Tax=Burkholderia diffusa TaxID=488732 RepID=A0A6P2NR79_9BURK|nr:hypothetical protein [Burkholderia diffusa]KAB0656356.1 hypothetical protein F7R23_14630 [Burkholderia diffusa]MBM2655680.1 hypothetical protein [Burkholderia diffusa]VWB97359.1 hypothetical protein BDI24065_04688 [Burkholderia diffusa]
MSGSVERMKEASLMGASSRNTVLISDAQRQALRADIRQRLVTALMRSGDAVTDPKLARLPGPVRYRVTGALAAWDALRAASDRVASPTLTEMLRSHGILRLTRYFDRFTRDLLPHGADGRPADVLAGVAQYSAVWLAFEVRKGAFYEPTPPLHRLLDAAYIAEDVPIGMLKMPTDTLCIIPEPTRWKQAGDIEAIAIFKNERSIGFATWLMAGGPSEGAVMDSITLPLEDPDKTIRELVDELFRKPAADGMPDSPDAQQFWRDALDYAIKMMLYLNVRHAQVVHDRAYSNAPRHFPGLGKRKRAERLAEIEQLYDRHIVGPAILDAEAAGSVPSDSAQREISGHWRRPHFRMQPYGPQAALRKLVFVGPTLVRPDRLGL